MSFTGRELLKLIICRSSCRLRFFFIPALFFLHLTGCDHSPKPTPADHMVISLQPFADIPASQVERVQAEIKKMYPHVNVNDPVPLPKAAFVPARQRYRADTIIRYLRSITKPNHLTIGLTTTDISVSNKNVQDWGVMGLGFMPGNACVVSTYRLKKKNLASQFYKVCVHELGHTQGLPHCEVKSCLMRDAKGGNPIDEEKAFCTSCQLRLKRKGWKF